MRTQDKQYVDYDLKPEDVNNIKNICRKSDCDQISYIKAIANIVNEDISEQLTDSLVFKMSYERLYAKHYTPIDKKSFYGYRRKLIYALNELYKQGRF